jgi:hypothetical protein
MLWLLLLLLQRCLSNAYRWLLWQQLGIALADPAAAAAADVVVVGGGGEVVVFWHSLCS